MPANPCYPYYEPGTRLTGHATAAVTGKRFAKISGDIQSGPGLSTATDGGNIRVATCGAGEKAVGVFGHDQASGQKVPLINGPGIVVPMTSGAAITAGQEVQSDATGRAIPLAAGKSNGMALSGVGAADTDVMVRLYT